MDAAYVKALTTSPAVILGRQLCPLSLGHLFILQILDSPFLTITEFSLEDLLMAIWVCSQEYQDIQTALSSIHDPKTQKKLQKFAKKWAAKNKRVNLCDEAAKFYCYLNDHLQAPRRWDGEGDRTPNVPWQLSVAVALMMRLGLTEQRAWSMPVALGLSYYAAAAEALGDENYLNEWELAELASEEDPRV